MTTALNGIEIKDITWKGRDKDGPTIVGVSFIPVAQEQVLMLHATAPPRAGQNNDGIICV